MKVSFKAQNINFSGNTVKKAFVSKNSQSDIFFRASFSDELPLQVGPYKSKMIKPDISFINSTAKINGLEAEKKNLLRLINLENEER
jgi:hypothetical protein